MPELHSNDTSREARPGITIGPFVFTGFDMVLLVGGAAAGISIFQILRAMDIDWWLNIIISGLPLCGVFGIVLFLFGKPQSYAGDLLLLWIWRAKTNLYLAGGLERPPLLWLETKVDYPKENL